jgi:drug/metabolite transporter (DMT)-like permease
LKVSLGLAVIYVVWGSVFVAIRFVVEEAPALLSIGLRYLVAGIVVGAIVAARRGLGELCISRAALVGCCVLAVLLQVLTNGTVTLAESIGVAAGPAALLSALAPVSIALLRIGTGDQPHVRTLAGIGVGFAGLAVLLLGGQAVPGFPIGPSLLVVASANFWAVGSFVQRRLELPRDVFVISAYQMIIGGVILSAAGFVSGEQIPRHLPILTWLVLAYLTVCSMAAYSTYVWLLDNAPISLVSTHAYVNPVVAVALGWMLLGEPISWPVLVGGAVVVVAVALIFTDERATPRRDPANTSSARS